MSKLYEPDQLTLQRHLAQKESIQSLIINAKQRLKQENERKKQIQQEISSAKKDAKVQLKFTLGTISDQINDIRMEIRKRNLIAKKVDKTLENFS